MKLYFISPHYDDLRLFYKEIPDGSDVNGMRRFNVGYNDSYEMRSQYISSEYFSTDPKEMEAKLEERKKELIEEEVKAIQKKITETYSLKISTAATAIRHDSIDCPF